MPRMGYPDSRFIWSCPVCGPARLDPWQRWYIGLTMFSDDEEAFEAAIEEHEQKRHAISADKELAEV